ncbi:MAG: hypothetical protein EFT35_01485 [Methanophagales archaeon ANME-1-THS]|nr:MAG: hypothetical protein EFT35_01485 [Methanophagales archaeon ANME-1-THS]
MISKTSKTSILPLVVALLLVIAIPVPGIGSNGNEYYFPFDANGTYFNQLMLTIYVDETGKALITGYVDEIKGLSFLETAEYLYENETHQLYALTNALTSKEGDLWALNFSASSFYTDYHTVLYLPRAVQLGPIQCSSGLKPLISVSNESLVIDLQGYDVESPGFTIEYRQPLKGDGGVNVESSRWYLLPGIAATGLVLVLIILVVTKARKKEAEGDGKEAGAGEEAVSRAEVTQPEKGEIVITSDMARVIETLTERERAIVQALIKHHGEMTQADLRYETEIPKSSLTGILRGLERRKLIRKKEWGRTNVIELSDWFLSKKGEK